MRVTHAFTSRPLETATPVRRGRGKRCLKPACLSLFFFPETHSVTEMTTLLLSLGRGNISRKLRSAYQSAGSNGGEQDEEGGGKREREGGEASRDD